MYMTENDVAIVFRDALKRVGSCLGVANIDLKSNAELYEEIANSGSDLIPLLNDFFNAYRAWYNYHLERDEKETFSDKEQAEVQQLMSVRNTTRNNLITKLTARNC